MRKWLLRIHKSQAETADGTGPELPELENAKAVIFYLNVTAMAGAGGTFIVTIEEQDPVSREWTDGSTNHPAAIITFTTVALAGPFPWLQRAVLDPVPGVRYRPKWDLATGATSVTFSLTAVCSSEEAS